MKQYLCSVFALFVLTMSCAFAQTAQTDKGVPNIFYPMSLGSEVWTGDNSAYSKVRGIIDKRIAAGQNPNVLVAEYQTGLAIKPNDKVAAFRWAYAVRKAALTVDPFPTYTALSALDVLNKHGGPYPYDYVRLQFVLASDGWTSISLKPLGLRLLNYRPDDRVVKLLLVDDLTVSRSLSDAKQAVSFAEQLMKQDPSNPTCHELLADACFWLWYKTKQQADADESLDEYRKYLQFAPPNASYRRIAQLQITHLQQSK